MFLIDLDTGGQRLPHCAPCATSVMAPGLRNIQHKKPLSSGKPPFHPVSPVTDPNELARVLPSLAPQPVVAEGKKSRLAKSKVSATAFPKPHSSSSSIHKPKMSDADDKKRNKLGYQRISIACAHCRRRKIRCLIAEGCGEDVRCQNCIRLKKECRFYPVDQQGAAEPRAEPRPGSLHHPIHTPASSMSPSQDAVSGRMDSGSHGYGAFSEMPGVGSGYHGMPITPNGPYPPSEYGLHQGAPPTPWSLPDDYRPQAPTIVSNGLPPAYMRYSNANVAAEYAPFPGALDPESSSLGRTDSIAYSSDGDRRGWPQHQPVRSMSYPDYPGDAAYNARYLHDPNQPAAMYQTQPPPPIPISAATMPAYGATPHYGYSPDQRNGNLSGLPMHPSVSGDPQWLQSGMIQPGTRENPRPLLSPQ